MKNRLLYGLLVCTSSALGYLTHEELAELQKEHALPADKKETLDQLFSAHPQVKEVFIAPKVVRPQPWGPDADDFKDPATKELLEAQGFYQDPGNQAMLLYRTQPGKNFPEAFDAQQHVWHDRPVQPVASINVGDRAEKIALLRAYENPAIPVMSSAKAQEYLAAMTQKLKDAGLENGSRSGNLTILLPDKKLVLCSSWRAWTTYPQVASRLINGQLWQKHFEQKELSHLGVPKMYLYHIPGQPEEFNEQNWIVVAELIEQPLTQEQVKEAIAHIPPHPFVAEVEEFLTAPTSYWKEPVDFQVNEQGVVDYYARFKLTKDSEGTVHCTFTNPEMPSLAGAYADEKRCADLSPTQITTVPSSALRTWQSFVAAVKKEVEEKAK